MIVRRSGTNDFSTWVEVPDAMSTSTAAARWSSAEARAGSAQWRSTLRPVPPATTPRSVLRSPNAIEDACLLRDVAVPIRLVTGEATAIRGERERVRAVLRSLLVQIGATVGPADVRIVVIGAPEHWTWVGWLPHVRTHTRGTLFAPGEVDQLAELTVTAEPAAGTRDGCIAVMPTTVLVIDDPALLAVRTGPLRRFMSESGAITIVAVDADATVPAVCRRTLDVAATGGAEWSGGSPERMAFSKVLVAGLDEPTACRAARAMTPLVDPEVPTSVGGRVPDGTTLASLDPASTLAGAEAIARRWTEAGRDPSLRAPIGVSSDGLVEVDLVADGPHALVAGTTGSGKSELLRTLVVSMATPSEPGTPELRADRLQGRLDVRLVRRSSAHGRAGDRPRRRSRPPCPGQPRSRTRPEGAAAA